MRKIIVILFLFNIKGFSQNTSLAFYIEGNIIGRDTGNIILRYVNNEEEYLFDTCLLQKGKFKFYGNITHPTVCILKGNDTVIDFYSVNDVSFFIDTGKTYITLVENDYVHAKVNGSTTQKEMDSLKDAQNAIVLKYKKLFDADLAAKKTYEKNKTDAVFKFQDSVHNLLSPAFEEDDSVVLAFIKTHPNSYVSVYYLSGHLWKVSIDSAELLFSNFTDKIQNSRYGKWITNTLLKKKSLAIGNDAPDFKAIDIRGKKIILTSFKGSYVLLDFWASWCLPCRAMTPYLINKYRQYHKNGFDIISISLDADKKMWQKAIGEDGTGVWHHVLENSTNDGISIKKMYMVTPIPVFILIDKEGKILGRWGGEGKQTEESLDKELKSVFGY